MKKWAIWKTILVVIASVVFVAGATVGGVYLAGGFKTKYINPDRISFVIDEKFFNAEYAQYEISGSDENLTFNAVIEGEKEGAEITQKTVTLDLDGGRIDYCQAPCHGKIPPFGCMGIVLDIPAGVW